MDHFCLIAGIGATALIAVTGFGLAAVAASRFRQTQRAVEEHLKDHAAGLPMAVAETIILHGEGAKLAPAELPPPLRAPGVRGAWVGDRHVTLYVYHNPDTDSGFRVWTGTPSDDYRDKSTSVPGVYAFVYCNDYPGSHANRPD